MIKQRSGVIVTCVYLGVEISFFVNNPSDEIQKYHFSGNFYENEELDIIRRFYKSDTIFVDIGSNIGNHAIFAEKILRAPEVIAFEPNPIAVAHLEINLRLNNCRRVNREFLGLAVSNKMAGRFEISLSPENNIGNTVFHESPTGGFRSITGDFALARRPVGFIKIDTEEMEFDALEGLETTIALWQPNIFIEVIEARESDLAFWASAHGYKIAESQKRYELLRNYVLVPA